MKCLILTEKPSVARDFASAFNAQKAQQDGFIETEEYVITWAIGHLLSPFDPEDYDIKFKRWTLDTLPILPIDFKFKPQPKTKKQLDIIKRLLKRTDIDKVIVATDAGREGELIARLILNDAKSKIKAFRFFTSAALTREVIHSELKNLKPLYEYDRLFIAGRARQKADWLVGMNLSRLATIKLGDLFSIGRVQTAVLGLLVERSQAINQFIPVDYFEMKATFIFHEKSLEAFWFDPEKKDEEKRQPQREYFEKLQKRFINKSAQVSLLKESEKTVYPQGLYSLTELQRQANIQFGFSAARTLELAQNLYEKYKCLSYPRTDSKVMATSSFELVKSLVYKFKEIFPDYFEKFVSYKVSLKNKNVFDDSRLTDHHGLIPLKDFSGNQSSPEGKIYLLVLKRFISNFLENHKYIETEIEICCDEEMFKTKGRKIIELGFKGLDGSLEDDILPSVVQNEIGNYKKSEIESKKTKPPSEYTEASLLYDMTNPSRLVQENDLKKIFKSEIGLGTQATRAQIIETLINRNYVERLGKNLKSTAKGELLIQRLSAMPLTSTLTNISQTAKLELRLQSMAEGDEDDLDFLDTIQDYVVSATNEWKLLDTIINKNKTYSGKFAKYNKSSNKPEVLESQLVQLGNCPICKAEIKNFPKSYSCSKWKEGCGFTIWKIVAKKKLSESQIKMLIKDKKTGVIKGFKSKAGKSFQAFLVLNNEGKVVFEFLSKA